MNLFQTIVISMQISLVLNLTEYTQRRVGSTQHWSIEIECFCSKTTPNRRPPDEPRKRSKNFTRLKSFHTQHTIRTLHHPTITFFAKWNIFCAVGGSITYSKLKQGVASFSIERTKNSTNAESSNSPIDGFKP